MPEDTVFAVASGKGGVGKTTTTVNVGTAFAGAGYEVAIVDADLGMANMAGFVNLSPADATLHEVLADEARLDEATYEVADGISAVPSGAELETYADVDAEGLKDVVEQLRERFDFVILDVGAGVSYESVLPLGLADTVLIVATPEPAAIQDASKTIDLVDRADGSVSGLVLTRVRPATDVSYEELSNRIDLPLLGKIPEDATVRESLYSGTPIVAYDPESPASLAYRNLASTLVTGISGPDRTPTIGDEPATDRSSPADPTADRTRTDSERAATATDGEGTTETQARTEQRSSTAQSADPDVETSATDGRSRPDDEDRDRNRTDESREPPDATFSDPTGAATEETANGGNTPGIDPGADTESDHDTELTIETEATELDADDTASDTIDAEIVDTDPESDATGSASDTTDPESDATGSASDTTDPESDATDSEEDLSEDAIPFQGAGDPISDEVAEHVSFDDDDDDDEESKGLFGRLFG